MELIHLSDKALVNIFRRLDAHEKARCQAVCKDWRRVLSTTRDLWGDLHVAVGCPIGEPDEYSKKDPVTVQDCDKLRVHLRVYSEYEAVIAPVFAWLGRLLRAGCFTSLSIEATYDSWSDLEKTDWTSRLAKAFTRDSDSAVQRVQDLAAAFHAALPPMQAAAGPVNFALTCKPFEWFVTFNDDQVPKVPLQGIKAHVNLLTAIHGQMPLGQYSFDLCPCAIAQDGSKILDLKRTILSLPRTVALDVSFSRYAAVDVLKFFGCFPTLALRNQRDAMGFGGDRHCPAVEFASPTKIENLTLLVDHFLGDEFTLSILGYAAKSLRTLRLVLERSNGEEEGILYRGLQELLASGAFRHLEVLYVVADEDATPILFSRMLRQFVALNTGPTGAGCIQPDAKLGSFLAALPPSVQFVSIQDATHSLHHAVTCKHGSAAVVQDLIRRGANVNARSGGGERCTPIATAARKGSLEAVRALLAHGADPGIKDAYKRMDALAHAIDRWNLARGDPTSKLTIFQELLRMRSSGDRVDGAAAVRRLQERIRDAETRARERPERPAVDCALERGALELLRDAGFYSDTYTA